MSKIFLYIFSLMPCFSIGLNDGIVYERELTEEDRKKLNQEINQLKNDIDIASRKINDKQNAQKEQQPTAKNKEIDKLQNDIRIANLEIKRRENDLSHGTTQSLIKPNKNIGEITNDDQSIQNAQSAKFQQVKNNSTQNQLDSTEQPTSDAPNTANKTNKNVEANDNTTNIDDLFDNILKSLGNDKANITQSNEINSQTNDQKQNDNTQTNTSIEKTANLLNDNSTDLSDVSHNLSNKVQKLNKEENIEQNQSDNTQTNTSIEKTANLLNDNSTDLSDVSHNLNNKVQKLNKEENIEQNQSDNTQTPQYPKKPASQSDETRTKTLSDKPILIPSRKQQRDKIRQAHNKNGNRTA